MADFEERFKAVCTGCKHVYASIEDCPVDRFGDGVCGQCSSTVKPAIPKRFWRMMDDIEQEDGSPSDLVWLVPMVPDGEYCPISGEPDFEEEPHHTAPDPKGPYEPTTVKRWFTYWNRKEEEAALEAAKAAA